MLGRLEQIAGRVVVANNDRLGRRALDRSEPNPRPTADLRWVQDLMACHAPIRQEWDAFVAAGHTLPRIEDLIQESQGNDGAWRAGLLVSRGQSVNALAHHFPATLAALAAIPGIWSALWSVLEPGTELPEHVGPNAGVLRLHLGVDCPGDTALRVGRITTPYSNAQVILFDDTAPHAAWNRSDKPRTTLFCEVLRPAPPLTNKINEVVQRILSLDSRYRDAPARAAAWELALNRP